MDFKIQKALASTEANPPVLIYDKDRKYQCQVPATDLMNKLFDRNGFKIYVEGIIDARGELCILGVLEDQGW
jgi:hypothetical protein